MELGQYRANIVKGADGNKTVEIYTRFDTLTKQQFCKVMKDVILYLGMEGYFDDKLPNRLEVFNKFGQIVRIEDMV